MTGSPYFADQTYTRIQELLDSPKVPVLLWPVGSTEPHGPHCCEWQNEVDRRHTGLL